MKKELLIILLLTVSISGCITPEEPGKSFENPIVIQADNEEEGVGKEYDWLKENGCKSNEGILDLEMQTLEEKDGHWFDLLSVICNNGEKETYYFQIDSFFGKWE